MNSPGISYRSCSRNANVWLGGSFIDQHLDDAVADQQVVAVAVDGGVRDEVVQVRVVREPRGIDDGRVVVHELAEEPERLRLRAGARDRSR